MRVGGCLPRQPPLPVGRAFRPTVTNKCKSYEYQLLLPLPHVAAFRDCRPRRTCLRLVAGVSPLAQAGLISRLSSHEMPRARPSQASLAISSLGVKPSIAPASASRRLLAWQRACVDEREGGFGIRGLGRGTGLVKRVVVTRDNPLDSPRSSIASSPREAHARTCARTMREAHRGFPLPRGVVADAGSLVPYWDRTAGTRESLRPSPSPGIPRKAWGKL